MVIPQVSSSVKMRRCGYCMVKVGSNSVLKENAQPLLLWFGVVWRHGRADRLILAQGHPAAEKPTEEANTAC